MTRDKLIELAVEAARRAGLNVVSRTKIVSALSNPSVTRVAVGSWFVDAEGNDSELLVQGGCGCPASLALGVSTEDAMHALAFTQWYEFAETFDSLVPPQKTGRLIEIQG